MCGLNDGFFFKAELSSFRALVLQHTVILLLLTGSCGGQAPGAQPPVRMVTLVGEDVVLPCRLEPPLDAVSKSVEWGRPDLEPRFVHVWHEGRDHLWHQNPSYRGRTSVSVDNLKQGDLSLFLSAVKISDNGLYRCFFPSQDKKTHVELVVGSVASPVIAGININSTAEVLQCESTGWYPEPEVFWLDGEGNLLSAGPTETVRGPDDLYTVSSRVTVEKRHSNSFTCRVQQNHINQTRETNVQISADCLEFTSCSAHVAVLVVFVLLFIVAAVCVVWKWRQIQTKERKKQQEDPTEKTDRDQLMGDRENMEKLQERLLRLEEELKKKDETLQKKDETLKKNKEEQKHFKQEVYSKLTEQSEELQKQREKLRQQQTDMETNIKVIEKEMQSVEKMAEGERFHRMKEITLTAKTQLIKGKQEDEQLQQQMTAILKKTNEMMNMIPDRKKEEAQEESQ